MRGSGEERQIHRFVFVAPRARHFGHIRSSAEKDCRRGPNKDCTCEQGVGQGPRAKQGSGACRFRGFAPVRPGGGSQVHAGPRDR